MKTMLIAGPYKDLHFSSFPSEDRSNLQHVQVTFSHASLLYNFSTLKYLYKNDNANKNANLIFHQWLLVQVWCNGTLLPIQTLCIPGLDLFATFCPSQKSSISSGWNPGFSTVCRWGCWWHWFLSLFAVLLMCEVICWHFRHRSISADPPIVFNLMIIWHRYLWR